MRPDALRIGQVAARAEVGAKALRFYEAKGLLAPASRGESGYRLYAADALDVLRFIKQAQGLGLTLDEIREIIANPPGRASALRARPRAPPAEGGRARPEARRPPGAPAADPPEPGRVEARARRQGRRLPAHRVAREGGPPHEVVAMALAKLQVKIGGMACYFCVETIRKGVGGRTASPVAGPEKGA